MIAGRDGHADQPGSTGALPGLDLLTRLSGRPREELLRDPAALAAALRALGDDLTGLLVDLVSDDDATRAAAAARRVEVLAALQAAPPPQERLRRRLTSLLDDVLARLREDGDGHSSAPPDRGPTTS